MIFAEISDKLPVTPELALALGAGIGLFSFAAGCISMRLLCCMIAVLIFANAWCYWSMDDKVFLGHTFAEEMGASFMAGLYGRLNLPTLIGCVVLLTIRFFRTGRSEN